MGEMAVKYLTGFYSKMKYSKMFLINLFLLHPVSLQNGLFLGDI